MQGSKWERRGGIQEYRNAATVRDSLDLMLPASICSHPIAYCENGRLRCGFEMLEVYKHVIVGLKGLKDGAVV